MRCFNALRRIQISNTDLNTDLRLNQLADWIRSIDVAAGGVLEAASDDASFRRYFRLQNGTTSFIAMDAPPSQESCLEFVRIAGFLEAMGLHAPRIIAADIENGFLLLSDLGNDEYLGVLQGDAALAATLYGDAMLALLQLQRRGVAYQSSLPPYDDTLLRFELSLFWDWLCGTHLQLALSVDDERDWQACCDVLVRSALDQPQVFVHRDYHSRNLMVTTNHNPGILDFQDAVEGPFTYDLVSLLKDCYIDWPAADIKAWAIQFYDSLGERVREQVDQKQFFRYFEFMGVQRQLKAAGIFCRLLHRDGKSRYLADVPRTLAYIVDVAPEYAELRFLGRLIEDKVLPAWSARS